MVKDTSVAIFAKTIFALCFLQIVCLNEAFAAENRQPLYELVEVGHRGLFSGWMWPSNLGQEPLSDRQSSFVKFFAFITANSKPVPKNKASKESDKPEDARVTIYDLLNAHGVFWIICFIVGLICGGAFGWPPFSKT